MDYTASIFNGVGDTTPTDYSLNKWLQYTIDPPKRWLKMVENYRQSFDKEQKKAIPCITMSGRFKNYRNEKNLDLSLPFLVIDVDRYAANKKKKCNQCIDMLLVKEFFMNLPFTYYCGYSLSGDGVYAVIYLAEINKIEKYFNWFLVKLQRIGVNIDESCKDVARLRFFSYDSEAYFNPEAKPLLVNDKQINRKPKRTPYTPKKGGRLTDEDKVNKLIEEINKFQIDITADYDDWVKIGGAIYSEFGESGSDYFHSISKFHPDYDYKNCQAKYNQCKRMNKVSLASLFKVATDYGARY